MSKIIVKTNRTDDDKHWDIKDTNYNFLKIIQNHYKEEYDSSLNNQLKKIINKFEHLQQHQKMEWSVFMFKKCEELFSKVKMRELKIAIKTLVTICYRYKIQYNVTRVQELIKYLYFQKYGDEVLPYFHKAGYTISEYQVLHYEDSWYTKVIRFFGF